MGKVLVDLPDQISVQFWNKKVVDYREILESMEDYHFWKIMEKNDDVSFDVNILEKKYLW
jgi:hypothetical protein